MSHHAKTGLCLCHSKRRAIGPAKPSLGVTKSTIYKIQELNSRTQTPVPFLYSNFAHSVHVNILQNEENYCIINSNYLQKLFTVLYSNFLHSVQVNILQNEENYCTKMGLESVFSNLIPESYVFMIQSLDHPGSLSL